MRRYWCVLVSANISSEDKGRRDRTLSGKSAFSSRCNYGRMRVHVRIVTESWRNPEVITLAVEQDARQGSLRSRNENISRESIQSSGYGHRWPWDVAAEADGPKLWPPILGSPVIWKVPIQVLPTLWPPIYFGSICVCPVSNQFADFPSYRLLANGTPLVYRLRVLLTRSASRSPFLVTDSTRSRVRMR
jgi:hypothetical protein